MAPNGWCMDINKRGWWRIESPDQSDALDYPIVFWSTSSL